MRFVLALALVLNLLLTGCSLSRTAAPAPGLEAGSPLQGSVYGGRQPISGARVYLLAANTTGYGNLSKSLLTTGDGSDTIGTYVLTNSSGGFSITGDYSCTSQDQVYLLALGGDPGAGANSAAGLMAILGSCPGTSFPSTTFISMNEVSTIAAAYSFAGFAVDPTHVSSSGSNQALLGIANAFANASNLVDLASGTALSVTPAANGANGAVPQARINTLGNILAACVNSTGPASTACSTLFANALSAGTTGAVPSDTATAAINLAHYPYLNIPTLCGLQESTPPYAPDLPCTVPYPDDFAIGIQFTGGGLAGGNPLALAIDAAGDVWLPTYQTGVLAKFSPLGTPLSGTGFTGGGLTGGADGITIDGSGHVWIADVNSGMSEFSSSGSPLSPSSGDTGGGQSGPDALAVDLSGSIWMANDTSFFPCVSKFNSAGTEVSGNSGYTGAGISDSTAIAIDTSNNAWIANFSPVSVSKMPNNGSSSGTVSYTTGGISSATNLTGIAIDGTGNVWATGSNLVAEISSSGAAISPSTGYTGGGVSVPQGIAIDGLGNAWIVNRYTGLSEFSNSGTVLSPSTSILGTGLSGGNYALAIDSSGNIWVASPANSSVVEFVGIAAPVITPTVAALSEQVGNSKLDTRP
jgi:hypothetical protein